ncbi:hypothetical protein ScPMuIL_009686 [Solemya velum]
MSSIKLEIYQYLDSLCEELRALDDAKAMRASVSTHDNNSQHSNSHNGHRGEMGEIALPSLRRQIAELRRELHNLEKEKGVHLHVHGSDIEVQQDMPGVEERVIISDDEALNNSTDERNHGQLDNNRQSGTHIYMHMMMDMGGKTKMDMGGKMKMDMDGKMKKMGMCPMMMKSMKKMRPDGYMYARCDVRENTGVLEDVRRPIQGTILMKQKYNPKGPVEVKIDLSGFDATLSHMHGMHIHQYGDVSNSCQSLGGHFNPTGKDHGAHGDVDGHLGDWGNIVCDDEGEVHDNFEDEKTTLMGSMSIIGRSIVIHAGQDDLGVKDNDGSRASGNAGPRIACCIIGQDRTPEPEDDADEE